MKKTLTIVALILAITVSLIAGTMSYYSITIDKLAEGSVVAKEFILLKDGTDTFEENVKIAPGETEVWTFSVKNYNDIAISETAMDLDIKVDVASAKDKEAIKPLSVTVTKENSGEQHMGTINGTGAIEFDDKFGLNTVGQSHTYTVTIEWPWETDGFDDTEYAGAYFGSALTVSVTGTQVQP